MTVVVFGIANVCIPALANEELLNVCTASGRVNVVTVLLFSQDSAKQRLGMSVIGLTLSKTIELKDVSLKELVPKLVTVLGIVIDVNPVAIKAELPMLSKLLLRVTVDSKGLDLNASVPITVLLIIAEVIAELKPKAALPMLVTVLGMVTVVIPKFKNDC